MAAYLIYFSLPLFVMILGYDLTKKTYKNQLAIGISRWYFFYVQVSDFLIDFRLPIYILLRLYLPSSRHSLRIWYSTRKFLGRSSPHDGIQFITFQAIFAVALLLLTLTFSNVSAVIGVIVTSMVLGIISAVLPKVEWLKYFDFQTNINIAWLKDMPEALLAKSNHSRISLYDYPWLSSLSRYTKT